MSDHRPVHRSRYEETAARWPLRKVAIESSNDALQFVHKALISRSAPASFLRRCPVQAKAVVRSTIANVLQRRGIEPSPERKRKTTWKEFLGRHWELIVAADFFTVEVWTRRGLQRFIVLFFIELSTRRVEIAGIAATVNGLWMDQIARNLTDSMDGILNGKRYLIHDRDPLFTGEFLETITSVGVESVKLPPRSPNLNSYAERFVRSIKESCLDRMIFFGEGALRKGIDEFVMHYHGERNHQGLGNRLIVPDEGEAGYRGAVLRRERLGGMLNYYYYRAAA